MDLVLETESAKDLQAAEAQISGLRIDEDLTSLFHQKRRDAVLGEQRGRGEPAGAGTDYQHGDMT